MATLYGLVSRRYFGHYHGPNLPGRMNLLAAHRHWFWTRTKAQHPSLPGVRTYGYCPPPIPTENRLMRSRPCNRRWLCPWCHARAVNRKAYMAFAAMLKEPKFRKHWVLSYRRRHTATKDNVWTRANEVMAESAHYAATRGDGWVVAIAVSCDSFEWTVEVGTIMASSAKIAGWTTHGLLRPKVVARVCGLFCKFPIWNLWQRLDADVPELWSPAKRVRGFRTGGACYGADARPHNSDEDL
jgi:hypothetical protein